MPRYDVPQLKGFGEAIQANQSMMSAFNNIGNQSQDYLKMEEQKKNNEWNRAFDTQKFDLETNKYNNGLQEKADTKSANVGTLKALYPTEYGNLSNTMGNNPNLLGNVDIGNVQSYSSSIAKANKDKEDTLYQAGRDKINDGFERDKITISRQNANKPSEIDRIMSILAPTIKLGANGGQNANQESMAKENIQPSYLEQPIISSAIKGGKIQEQTQPQQTQQQVVPQQAQQSLNVGVSNQKYGIGDYLTKGAEDTLKEANGDIYKSNPLTGINRLIEKAPEKATLETTKLRNELNDEKIVLETGIKNTDRGIGQLKGLINNPSLKYATGVLSSMGNLPGTPFKDIASEIETIKSGTFLSGIEALKGSGALSDAEGKKVSDAIANLDRAQSPGQVKKQLGYVLDVYNTGRDNYIKKLKNRGIEYKSDRQEHTDEDILKLISGGK